jgi:hypothetical protein
MDLDLDLHTGELTSSGGIDSTESPNVDFKSPHCQAATKELQMVELSVRATILGDEFTERGNIADGRLSLAEPGIYLCPAPRPAEFYASFLKRKRLELTAKYQDLVTRQMLREERWLEYTVALLQELVEDESTQRAELLVASLQDIPRLTLCHMQLQMVSAQGTEGTVIFVEEMEREIRFRVMIFEEVQEYEALLSNEAVGCADAKRREEARLAEEHDARGCIGAAEWNARWLLEREEDSEFPHFGSLASQDRDRITSLLVWRMICQEADERFAIEREWSEMLYPSPASENGDDDNRRDVTDHYLADAVVWHDLNCSDLHAEVRTQRQDREEAAVVAAQAFTLNCPVADAAFQAAVLEDERSPTRLVENENAEMVLTSPTLVLYGHRFDVVPLMRRAGEMPPVLPAPQQAGVYDQNTDDDRMVETLPAHGSDPEVSVTHPVTHPVGDLKGVKTPAENQSPSSSEHPPDGTSAGRCTDEIDEEDNSVDDIDDTDDTLSWDAVRAQSERVEALWRNLS